MCQTDAGSRGESWETHRTFAGYTPEPPRSTSDLNQRYYGEAPGRLRCGPLVRAPRFPFAGGVRIVVRRHNARLAGSGFAVSLTWLKAGLLALRQIVHMNWQEMWSRDWPRP
jgi:hypothetical protein